MKRLLYAVAAIALIAPSAGVAQPHNERHQGNRAQQRENRGEHHQSHGHNARPNHERGEGRAMENHARHHEGAHHSNRPTNYDHSDRRMNHHHGNRAEGHEVYRPGHRPASFHRIQAPAFHYPHGYRYRRWGIGAILPGVFLAQPYYWTNWGALGLLPPPPSYVWVRFGPDLLLVNRYTGRIADVIYGAFY